MLNPGVGRLPLMRIAACPLLSLTAAVLLPAPADAAMSAQGTLCRAAIAAAEAGQRIPDAFLSAIAKVESGRQEDGMVVPWPWTINAEGAGSFFASKEDAIAAVRQLQARGVRSIDVGCLQVNLQQHPDAFTSLDEAFDPDANARYAARFLTTLFAQFGSWPLAAAAYHSQTPTVGAAYQKQVLAAWAQPDRPGPASPRPAPQRNPAQTNIAAQPQMKAAAVTYQAVGRQSWPMAPSLTPGPAHAAGRSLAAYRLAPVALALRPPARPG
jgi:hypothetical protein